MENQGFDVSRVDENDAVIQVVEKNRPDRREKLMAAREWCPRHRLVFVGPPLKEGDTEWNIEWIEDAITPDFKTTVDDTEWRG